MKLLGHRHMFSFTRNYQNIFQSVQTVTYLHQQSTRAPVAPHPHQHLMLLVFLRLAILMDV